MRCKKARQHAKGQKDIAIIAVSKNGRKETIDEKILKDFEVMLLDENHCREVVHVTITQFFPLDIFFKFARLPKNSVENNYFVIVYPKFQSIPVTLRQ